MPDRDTRFDDQNPWDPETGTLRTPLSEALKKVSPFEHRGGGITLPKNVVRRLLDKASRVDPTTGVPKPRR
jgi:hypothetical protein